MGRARLLVSPAASCQRGLSARPGGGRFFQEPGVLGTGASYVFLGMGSAVRDGPGRPAAAAGQGPSRDAAPPQAKGAPKHGLHSAHFRLDEDVLGMGAAYHAALATAWLAPRGQRGGDEL